MMKLGSLSVTGWLCLFALAVICSAEYQKRDSGISSDEGLMPKKRPFCNAFNGCGRKRSDPEISDVETDLLLEKLSHHLLALIRLLEALHGRLETSETQPIPELQEKRDPFDKTSIYGWIWFTRSRGENDRMACLEVPICMLHCHKHIESMDIRICGYAIRATQSHQNGFLEWPIFSDDPADSRIFNFLTSRKKRSTVASNNIDRTA